MIRARPEAVKEALATAAERFALPVVAAPKPGRRTRQAGSPPDRAGPRPYPSAAASCAAWCSVVSASTTSSSASPAMTLSSL